MPSSLEFDFETGLFGTHVGCGGAVYLATITTIGGIRPLADITILACARCGHRTLSEPFEVHLTPEVETRAKALRLADVAKRNSPKTNSPSGGEGDSSKNR